MNLRGEQKGVEEAGSVDIEGRRHLRRGPEQLQNVLQRCAGGVEGGHGVWVQAHIRLEVLGPVPLDQLEGAAFTPQGAGRLPEVPSRAEKTREAN